LVEQMSIRIHGDSRVQRGVPWGSVERARAHPDKSGEHGAAEKPERAIPPSPPK
jgi:hypothetical protein